MYLSGMKRLGPIIIKQSVWFRKEMNDLITETKIRPQKN